MLGHPGGETHSRYLIELSFLPKPAKWLDMGAGDGSTVPVAEDSDKLHASVAAPILAEGDLLGLVLFIGTTPGIATGDTEYKLAQTIAAFLGRHMEG